MDPAQINNCQIPFSKRSYAFSINIPSAMSRNRIVRQISYHQIFGFWGMWRLHYKNVNSKSQSSFLRESMAFEWNAIIWIHVYLSLLDRMCAVSHWTWWRLLPRVNILALSLVPLTKSARLAPLPMELLNLTPRSTDKRLHFHCISIETSSSQCCVAISVWNKGFRYEDTKDIQVYVQNERQCVRISEFRTDVTFQWN
jgi:hypothetical protein